MEPSTRRTTMAPPSSWPPWLLLLLLLCLAAGGILQSDAQPDSKGFISIDCGYTGTSYVDDSTTLSYSPDAGFNDAGTNHNISGEYNRPLLSRRSQNLRSFPDGTRNCYTLRSLVSGLKYLIRATFFYGNYDGLNQPPVSFDLYIGVNFWASPNMSSWSDPTGGLVTAEAIVVVPDDFVQVCLVNTGAGTPFISGLDLRPLKRTLYPQATAAQGLVMFGRLNAAPTNKTYIARYPDDPHDRIWYPWYDAEKWAEMSTTERVQNIENDLFEAPSAVMQTAITPRNASNNIEFYWDAKPKPNDPLPGYIAIMYFTELQLLNGNDVRQFYVNLNGNPWFPAGVTPQYLSNSATYNSSPSRLNRYNISINATSNSTLPPILNAVEVFSVIPTTNIGTDSQDASASMSIKAKYQVQKNWMGDPCLPKNMAWDRLTCSYAIDNPSRITSINMSSSGLTGDISSSFAKLKALLYLDLSNNSLTGSIPDALSQLPSVTVIDLSGNQLSGSIPPGLLKRIEDGSLDLRHGNNPDLCTGSNSCHLAAKMKNKVAIYVAVPILVILVIVSAAILVFFLLRRRNQQQGSMNNMTAVKPQDLEAMSTASYGGGDDDSLRIVDNRRFTYKELEMITNGFQRMLGQGGFGRVYDGFLEDGTQVAVKLRSHASSQGVKEFLAEARVLTRIHHKNLVSMIGYCKDGEYMALVYEYMAQGTLREHIAGTDRNRACLPWRQRLQIALESAQGLEYLHRGCNPPLIHRDVKATNILLNARLEAKIADFGLSRAFNHDTDPIPTNTLVGTPGYVDPEYQATMQPTTKSDVYSFGVVLLELVTGMPAVLSDPEPTSIIHWARQRLARGNIEGVVDACMRGAYDVNCVWKVAEIALECTTQASAQRPTMADVVAQLQECIELEKDRAAGFYTGGSSSSVDDPSWSYGGYASGQFTYVSNSTAFEMERRVPTVVTGPAAR
ncbi:putative leucine-rich repeat receptor-like protein kinase At2g19210 [Brachypodium distachyon]|uniref:putative leucine-rich repeat receptor-like protein kinase At2g19210 n=1 Tax=Brachypodium distachyon TaxID=15368 RepID=UPI000D0D1914|nr:putative leucine-rich repeat receptor-like protein kinase At2g19210 [Brachypodium distachyon]|eukprot:XP_003566697.3 putative leucine-rich repeat receptor-like protein kinase At2g19210 [Brachypodium distachyon]